MTSGGVDAVPAPRRRAARRAWRLYWRVRWGSSRTLAARVRFLSQFPLRPFSALASAVHGARTYGATVRRVAGVPVGRQFLHQWAIGTRFGFGWDAYYRYRLYRLPDVGSAALFLTLEANMLLRAHLYRKLEVDPSLLADKRKFYRTCVERGLPVAPTVADFDGGEVRWWPGEAEGVLPPRDLFSKEANNIKGIGAARWFFLGDGRYRGEDGNAVTGAELVAHLRERSRSAAHILQVRLTNHPAIAPVAPETLCTVRIVTYRDAGGDPQHLASTFRMAGGPFAADNFSQRGLATRVDGATGELGPAVYKELHDTAVDHAVHPVFGSPIKGVRLPEWEKVVDLALRAHRVFHDFPSVGWDVAITPDGPVLVEGNYNWNVVLTQQAGARPIGETPFFESYLSHMEAHMK